MPVDLFSKMHVPHFGFHKSKISLNEHTSLYLTHTLRILSSSLIGVFVPIFIYTTTKDTLIFNVDPLINGISWIVAYFFLRSIMVWVSIFVFGSAIFEKLHFQLSIVLSYIFLALEIILLLLSKQNHYLLFLAGGIAGLKVTFYWIPYHSFFVHKTEDKPGHSFGKDTGLRFFLVRIFSGLAPVIGGFVIGSFGFNVLFVLSILMLVAASVPIIMVVHDWKHRKHDIKNVLKEYILNKRYYKLTLAFVGDGMESIIYMLFWPLLLFFALENFEKVGLINGLSMFLSSILVLIIGGLIDKVGSKKIHAIGVFFNTIFYIPRMIIFSANLFYVLDVVDRLNSSMYSLPMMSSAYDKAKKIGSSDFIIFRELAIHGGIIITTLIVLMAVNRYGVWLWVFMLAMLGSSLTYLIDKD